MTMLEQHIKLKLAELRQEYKTANAAKRQVIAIQGRALKLALSARKPKFPLTPQEIEDILK